jgi:ubiquinone/menaquinone biosynthesis C-methylase UbiE
MAVDELSESKAKTARTYNAAASHFDDPILSFWDLYGRGTVERLTLSEGDSVLDVCAGSGASAIPAAVRVGPSGHVVAVDLAANLLALASEKARALGLANLEVRVQDVETLDYPPESFDAVIIVFGIFFLPDTAVAMRQLWSLVKPGGQLAVTTWAPGFFEPGSTVFWEAVKELRPVLYRSYNPWDELTDPAALRQLFVGAGAANVSIEEVKGSTPVRTSEDFWTLILGTGFRATVEALDSPSAEALRSTVVANVAAKDVHEVETSVIYGVATKG